METVDRIKDQIANHPMIVYMKGTPQFPQCGFSGQVAHILGLCQAQYAYVNILENPDIRATLPQYAKWPTFPQLYIKGELIGGCDIITEPIMINVRAPLLESRLDNLAKTTGRTKSHYVKAALEAFLDEQEEIQIALQRLQDKLPGMSLEEMEKKLGLED